MNKDYQIVELKVDTASGHGKISHGKQPISNANGRGDRQRPDKGPPVPNLPKSLGYPPVRLYRRQMRKPHQSGRHAADGRGADRQSTAKRDRSFRAADPLYLGQPGHGVPARLADHHRAGSGLLGGLQL